MSGTRLYRWVTLSAFDAGEGGYRPVGLCVVSPDGAVALRGEGVWRADVRALERSAGRALLEAVCEHFSDPSGVLASDIEYGFEAPAGPPFDRLLTR